MDSTTTTTNGSIVVHELSRATSFSGTSRLRLRLDGHREAVWEAVWALFAHVQFYDREIGTIRGRIEEPGTRFRLRANQWVTSRFEERQEDHSVVTFEINVKFLGRALDGFVFNRMVQMLKDGVKARQNATWFSRLTADTKTPAEAIITGNVLPLSCAILGCILLDLILVGVGDALYHSDKPILSGGVNGIFLALLFFFIPVGLVLAVIFGLYVLAKRRHVALALASLLVLAFAVFLWSDLAINYYRSFSSSRDQNLGKHAYGLNSEKYLGVVEGQGEDRQRGPIWIIRPPGGYPTMYAKPHVDLKEKYEPPPPSPEPSLAPSVPAVREKKKSGPRK